MNHPIQRPSATFIASTALAAATLLVSSTGAHALHRVDAIMLDDGELAPRTGVIDPAGQYAYFATSGGGDNPVKVVKIDLATFARVGAITLEPGELQPQSSVMDPAGKYAYFGTNGLPWLPTEPSRVVKIDLGTFERVGAITLASGEQAEQSLWAGIIDPDGEYAYFGTYTNPAHVVKIDLNTFERVGALVLDASSADIAYLGSAVMDPAGAYAYFGDSSIPPGKVVKIDLKNFEWVENLEFQSDEGDLISAVIDPAGEFAYFGTWSSGEFDDPPSQTQFSKVVKVNLETFERVGAIHLGAEVRPEGAVIDPAGAFAFFTAWDFPSRVVKIDLDTFERVHAIELEEGEDGVYPAVIDPHGTFAYLATDFTGVPGIIVKVGLVPEGVRLVVEPFDPLDFGRVQAGGESGLSSLLLTSSGAETVTISDVSGPEPPFLSAGGSCGGTPFTLSAGESCTLDFMFTPDEEGPAESTITIASDAIGAPHNAELQGLGLPPTAIIGVNPENLGIELQQGEVVTETLAIGNSGIAPLEWTIAGGGLPDAGVGFIRSGDTVECETELGIMRHDDGTIEGGYGEVFNPATTSLAIVDQFTPGAYPASLRSVCLSFLSHPGGPTSLDFEIVIFAAGEDGMPGAELAAMPATANEIPVLPFPVPPDLSPVWYRYDISGLDVTVESGSVFVGARWAPSGAPAVLIAADDTADGRPPGYAGGYFFVNTQGFWIRIEDFFPGYRALFVRAVADLRGCLHPDAVPWLGIAPDAGSTPAGASSEVQVTIDGTGLDPGVYHASVCIENNDPLNSLFVVPVEVNVTPAAGAALAFDPEALDFGAVEVGSTSPPLDAWLQNIGAVDATGLVFGALGGGFQADAGACGGVLGAGKSCTVTLHFTPAEVGAAEATLSVTGDGGAAASLGLAGHGSAGGVQWTAAALEVDYEPLASDGNAVFEPGESVLVAPAWRNDGSEAGETAGTVSGFTGPMGAIYAIDFASAQYGLVAPGADASCRETGICYELGVDDPVERPATLWVASFEEKLSDDTSKTWNLHIGDSFTDVPRSSPFYRSIETLLHHEVTGGCGDTEYCPTAGNTRGQMPVFLLRALEGADFVPDACTAGEERFADVPAASGLCPWIEELANRDVTGGCGEDVYCPNAPVNRQQMAIFLLRTLEGEDYTPPACSGGFGDVPCTSVFAPWVEELARRGVTGGCSVDPPLYCPTATVNRQQMAVFVAGVFELTLYGP